MNCPKTIALVTAIKGCTNITEMAIAKSLVDAIRRQIKNIGTYMAELGEVAA